MQIVINIHIWQVQSRYNMLFRMILCQNEGSTAIPINVNKENTRTMKCNKIIYKKKIGRPTEKVILADTTVAYVVPVVDFQTINP